MAKAKNQFEAIKELLREKKPINLMSAFKACGTMKLSTRCSDLTRLGWKIKKEVVNFKTRFGTNGRYTNYTLMSEPKASRTKKTTKA
jgi:hypothetical protein